jgi:hypothetical protein
VGGTHIAVSVGMIATEPLPTNGNCLFIVYFKRITCHYIPDNSVALIHDRTIPTERPPLVGGVSVNFFG